jgi:glycosidase
MTSTINLFHFLLPHYLLTRLILLFILSLGLQITGYAQIITTEPEFPTADDSVTVFYDATKGTAGLKDFNGDVYAHTGVITDQSTTNSDWKYVLADFDENIPKAKMEQVDGEANLYKLEITPDIREFYGVPEGETIEQMAFVFRNSDGSKEGKADGGADIFANVYENSFNVKLTQPAEPPTFHQKNTSVTIKGVASSQSSGVELTLFIDGQQVQQANNDTISYAYNTQTEGNFEIRLEGTDGTNTDNASQQLIVNPEINQQARPQNLKDGITYLDDSTVRLSLFAPHKEFAYLVGEFTDWEIQAEYFMNRDSVNADSSYFWIELGGLIPGGEYGFQYLVNGKIRIGDPYTEKILDPNHDANIPESIYPNLKPYPQGQTQHLVSVLHPGQQQYNWQNNTYDRPDNEKLVIYELLVRDFLEQHDYQTLTDTLGYLQRLGVNAIELMPVMEFEANNSWGYNTALLFATDKYYGPAEDLKAFIDEAHSRGIAVILDIVLNHVYGQSPLVRLWNEGTYGQPTPENPYLNVASPNQTFSFGYDFNHESAATQYYVDRVTRFWLEEYKIDGYRFDFTKGFTQNPGEGSAYDADRIRILKRMANRQWAVDDSSYVILEHFAQNQEEQELSQYGMMLWGNYNYNYNEATMGYPDESNFSGIYHKQRGWDDAHLVGYMESHDEERLMYKNLQFGNSSGEYDVTELNTALNRVKMAGAFFFTIPGPKMIWQFGELGYDISIDKNGRTGEKPIKWEYYSDKNRKRLYNTFQALIKLRAAHPAFTSEDSQLSVDLENAAKRITITHPDMDVSIVGNFGVTAMDKEPAFAQSGTWYEFFSGDTLNITNTDTTMSLEPGEFHIYTTQKFEQPENVFAGETDEPDEGDGEEPTGEFQLLQNYPNPFQNRTTIPYELAEPSDVTIRIFNILGQEVWKQDLGEQQAGPDEVDISGANLSSGVYIYRLDTESNSSTRKMMLIK